MQPYLADRRAVAERHNRAGALYPGGRTWRVGWPHVAGRRVVVKQPLRRAGTLWWSVWKELQHRRQEEPRQKQYRYAALTSKVI